MLHLSTQSNRSAAYSFHKYVGEALGVKNRECFSKDIKGLLDISRHLAAYEEQELACIVDFGIVKMWAIGWTSKILGRKTKLKFFTSYYHHIYRIRQCIWFRDPNEYAKIAACIFSRIAFWALTSTKLHFITVSRQTKLRIASLSGIEEENIFCMYNQIFDRESRYYIKGFNKSGYSRDGKILIVSSLRPRKNISAVKYVAERCGERLTIVSNRCSSVFSATEIKALGINLYANLSREKLLELYHTHKVVIVPSYIEGLSLVPWEAGVRGCILLLSDIPTHRMLGLPDKHYFNPRNHLEIMRRVKLLLEDSDDEVLNVQTSSLMLSFRDISETQGSEYIRLQRTLGEIERQPIGPKKE